MPGGSEGMETARVHSVNKTRDMCKTLFPKWDFVTDIRVFCGLDQ